MRRFPRDAGDEHRVPHAAQPAQVRQGSGRAEEAAAAQGEFVLTCCDNIPTRKLC